MHLKFEEHPFLPMLSFQDDSIVLSDKLIVDLQVSDLQRDLLVLLGRPE